ncbi:MULTISPECIES: hypothetical protein [unclassified Candidatus Cardinium]|uniref:hypothetical protein n=1 Tax=unclassified Candidatus Cardinium TaxID=2641185 RepID=UPI001FB55FFF|nr:MULTISPECIES: hypothetical protein [unclassified Candidatus Cardinium]
MATIFNNFLVIYGRFTALLLAVDSISCQCKNAEAYKKINPVLERKEKKSCPTQNASIASNAPATIQKSAEINVQGNFTNSSNDSLKVEEPHQDESAMGQLAQADQRNVQPSFTLKDITIYAGAKQSHMLEVAGITAGYNIKSISVSQNRIYYTKQFGVELFNNQPIPTSGLAITLAIDSTLKAGVYELKIKIGKTGKGSKKTEQSVTCMIHVIKDEAKVQDTLKIEKQNKSSNISSTTQTIPVLQSETINHMGSIIEDEPDTAKNKEADLTQAHITPTQPSFSLQDITMKAGTQESVMLEATGDTEGYGVKSISVSQDRVSKAIYYTKKFGVEIFNNKPIPSSGLPIILNTDSTLQAGSYQLKIKIGQTGKGSQRTEQWVTSTIYIIQDQPKKEELTVNQEDAAKE